MNESDQIDQSLTEFFRSEAPKSWPKLPTQPSPAVMAFRSSDPLAGGRIALAASTLILLAASWWLAGTMLTMYRTATFDDTTATRPADMRIEK